MVELMPFSRISWRSKAIADKWEPIRGRIYDCVYFAEYEMVKRGYRSCDVYDFGPHNMMQRLKKPTVDGMFFLPMLISQTYGGYGHRHYVVNEFGKDTFVYGVVSNTLDGAIKFHDAGVTDLKLRIWKWKPEEMNPTGIDHAVTGQLLGYPKCCVEFFNKTWLKGGCLDPMYEMAENTKNHEVSKLNHIKVSGNPMLNRLARYWGFNIIPFFPHAFDCMKAADFADTFFTLMRERDAEAADSCLEILSMPMKWSMMNAVTVLEHPLFIGSANGYYRPEKVTVEWFPND